MLNFVGELALKVVNLLAMWCIKLLCHLQPGGLQLPGNKLLSLQDLQLLSLPLKLRTRESELLLLLLGQLLAILLLLAQLLPQPIMLILQKLVGTYNISLIADESLVINMGLLEANDGVGQVHLQLCDTPDG